MRMRRKDTTLLVVAIALAACGSDDGGGPASGDVADGPDAVDVSDADGDAAVVPADGLRDGDAAADTADGLEDGEVGAPTGLPTELGFTFERPAGEDPPTAAETEEVTRAITAFYDRVDYFDWLLRISHGVHESTGYRDFSAWWTTTHAEKEGDVVTIVHEREDPAGGGHNMMTRTSKLLASNIAGYLLTGDEAMGTIAEQYCKGVSATMLGMVFDEDDPLEHIMSRNVITFSHGYTTHDGRDKQIDYSAWQRTGCRWNTCRFPIEDNPYWGPVHVTALRSKDDVSRILRVATTIAYAVEETDGEVQAACTETLELLRAFGRDVVDSGYIIRSKNEDGEVYEPGTDEDPMKEDHTDISSYVSWEDFIPNAECSAKRAVSFLGYGDDRGNACGKAWGNEYEEMAIQIHYFNIWIIRSHHLANVAQSLLHRDWDAAKVLLQGLAERYAHDRARDPATLGQPRDRYDRDLAASMMQAAALGYPLDGEEARLVQRYYLRAAEWYAEWPHWDLWDPAIPDGSYEYRPPHQEPGEDGEIAHWIRPEDMGAVLDYCWSPFRNPAGVPPVDCDLVADPSTWDGAWFDGR